MKKNLIILISTIVYLFCLTLMAKAELSPEERQSEIITWKFYANTEQAIKDGYDNMREYGGFPGRAELFYQLLLGHLYYDGQYVSSLDGLYKVEQDYTEAYKWFLIAANYKIETNKDQEYCPDASDSLDVGEAQLMIAKMCYEGKGVDVNYPNAYRFADRAWVTSRQGLGNKGSTNFKDEFKNIETETAQIKNQILSSNYISKKEAEKIEAEIRMSNIETVALFAGLLALICWICTSVTGVGIVVVGIGAAIGIGMINNK
jgi:hypothetical protein